MVGIGGASEKGTVPWGRLGRVVRQWLDEPALAALDETASPVAWALVTAVVVGVLALAAYPGRAVFGIDFQTSLLAFVPAPLFLAAEIALLRRRSPNAPLIRLVALTGCASMQFFFLFIAASSRPIGMASFGAIFLMAAAYHGVFNRASLRHVPAALVTPVAVGVAVVVTRGHSLLLLVALGSAGSVTAIYSGAVAEGLAHRRRENEALRAAVQAQIDAEREQTLSRFRESVVAASGLTHDLANEVLATSLGLAELERCLTDRGLLPGAATAVAARGAGGGAASAAGEGDDLAAVLADLRAGLAGIEALVASARADLRAERARLVEFDQVRPAQVLAAVLPTVARRFPRVDFVAGDADPALSGVMRGGASALARVLENLLVNACEGDGARGATQVRCRLLREASGANLCVEIRDDGPGFPPAQLAAGVVALKTTKQGGTGLGLFTVDRLLRASGGRLEIDNHPEGGARVRVVLATASA